MSFFIFNNIVGSKIKYLNISKIKLLINSLKYILPGNLNDKTYFGIKSESILFFNLIIFLFDFFPPTIPLALQFESVDFILKFLLSLVGPSVQ